MPTWVKSWADAARNATAIIALLAMLTTALTWLFHPHLKPFLDGPAAIAKLANDFETFGRRLSYIEGAVHDLQPTDRIAEYDGARSQVFGPCIIGSDCSVEMRLKRTEFGDACGTPAVSPVVVNHGGIRHPTKFTDGFQPVRVQDEWTVLRFVFYVPENTLPGIAEFFNDLEYPGCPGETGPRRERSITLLFEIKAS